MRVIESNLNLRGVNLGPVVVLEIARGQGVVYILDLIYVCVANILISWASLFVYVWFGWKTDRCARYRL